MSSKINEKRLSGVLAVLQTPFKDSGSIDHATLEHEIQWALELAADGVVIAMVSEILRLDSAARRELAEAVVATVDGRAITVISAGAESIDQALSYASHAERIDASAVMAIPPVATTLGSRATLEYFSVIAESISIPLIVQDASGYVGQAIDLSVYLQLLERFGPHRIYFKPEASPLGPNLTRLRDASRGEARIFEGSGGIHLVDCYRRGIVGTMPGTDLLDGIIALWQALERGDEDRIYQLSLPISGLVALQLQGGLDGFLGIEKYLLKKRGIFINTLQRQPVAWELDEETAQEVDRLFSRMMALL